MQPRRRRQGNRVGVYSRLHREQGNAAAPREEFMIRTTTLLIAALALGACGPVPGDDPCVLEEDNYLQDVDFALEAQSSRSKHWTGIQHTGEKSFAVAIADGVLSIDKVGSQPWFLYRQRLPAGELAGQRVVFSAEVRLVGRAAEGPGRVGHVGGLKLSALSAGKAELRLEQRLAAVEPAEQWQPLRIIAQLPRYTDTLELSFFHESDGVLEVRGPALQVLDPDAAAGCENTR